MNHSSAIMLWNECCQNFMEQCSSLTKLGAAATAKDVPVRACEITNYELREMRFYPQGNRIIASFLREWADSIERKGEADDEKA